MCSAYRTVSRDAVLVISGIVLIEEPAKEGARLAALDREERNRGRAREETLQRWQRSWETTTHGHWTRSLIPDVRVWQRRGHGEVNYWLTQLFSGHGSYGSYLFKIGRRQKDTCGYCGEDPDDVEHAVLLCPRWTVE